MLVLRPAHCACQGRFSRLGQSPGRKLSAQIVAAAAELSAGLANLSAQL